MAKLILGIAGEMGSGKGTIAKYVTEELKGSSHRFSTVLRDILDRLYLEQTRDNMQKMSEMLRKNFSEDILAESMAKDVEKDEHDVVVVDGVRRLPDIKHLKEFPHFKLMYVEADIEKRFERISKRRENVDDEGKTFDEFKREQQGEAESQIIDLKNYASIVIDNNGTFAELYAQIEGIVKENIK